MGVATVLFFFNLYYINSSESVARQDGAMTNTGVIIITLSPHTFKNTYVFGINAVAHSLSLPLSLSLSLGRPVLPGPHYKQEPHRSKDPAVSRSTTGLKGHKGAKDPPIRFLK